MGLNEKRNLTDNKGKMERAPFTSSKQNGWSSLQQQQQHKTVPGLSVCIQIFMCLKQWGNVDTWVGWSLFGSLLWCQHSQWSLHQRELAQNQSAIEASTRNSPLFTSKTQNSLTQMAISFVHFMTDTVQSYWETSVLKEAEWVLLLLHPLLMSRNPSHVFFNNEIWIKFNI